MKKSRVLSLVLTFALVFTTVFASTGSAFADSKMPAKIGTSSVQVDRPTTKKVQTPINPTDALNCTTVLSSSTSTAAYKSTTMPAGYFWLTTVTPKSNGLMYLDVKVTGTEDSYDNIEAYYIVPGSVYEENGMVNWQYYLDENGLGYYWTAWENERMQTEYDPIPVTSGETYQILFVSDSYNDEELLVEARAKVYTTGSRTLSQGSSKWTIASGMNRSGESSTTYFKVKPDTTGVMKVSLKEYGYSSSYGTVTLYNADKKVRSEAVTYSSSTGSVMFGVKKGTTYYLKVTNCQGSGDEFYKFGIKYTVSSGTDRSIGSKSKAKQIYRKGDSVSSTFVAANANSVDYYKFKVTTARSTKITVKNQYMSSGYTTMRLYKSNGTLVRTLEIPAGYEGYISSSKLAKGTYYVKITKSKKNSGKYSIKWTY